MIEPITMYQLRCDNCKEVIKPDGEHSSFDKEDVEEWASQMISDKLCLFEIDGKVVCDDCRTLNNEDEWVIDFHRFVIHTAEEYAVEVRKKYKKAIISIMIDFKYGKQYRLFDGKGGGFGEPISEPFDTEREAWKNAYERIKTKK